MTTNTSEPDPENHPAAEPPDITPVFDVHQQPDRSLAAIASFSDFVGIPLTLYMPWGVVSGNTAPYADYFKYLGDTARSSALRLDVPPDWAEAIDKFVELNFDEYANMKPSERTEKSWHKGVDLTSSVVLKDANCWVGQLSNPVHHDYLRIRLPHVTAWSWGVLTAS